MKKTLYILFVLYIISLPATSGANTNVASTDSESQSMRKSGTVWKYEQDLTKYAFIDGIAKKVYYLTLFIDGTYHQYVQIIPSNSKNYYGIRYYELDGDWSYKDNKIFLVENGKKNAIDYDYFNANFENVDNQLIMDKK